MNAKLTLSFDKNVIKKAKQYAETHHTSVSALVQNFLNSLTEKKEKVDRIEISPLVKKLGGVALGHPAESDDEILYQELLKKHG